jgi:hypothetical protein
MRARVERTTWEQVRVPAASCARVVVPLSVCRESMVWWEVEVGLARDSDFESARRVPFDD